MRRHLWLVPVNKFTFLNLKPLGIYHIFNDFAICFEKVDEHQNCLLSTVICSVLHTFCLLSHFILTKTFLDRHYYLYFTHVETKAWNDGIINPQFPVY